MLLPLGGHAEPAAPATPPPPVNLNLPANHAQRPKTNQEITKDKHPAPGAVELRYDLRIDLPMMIGGGGAWVLTELLINKIGPSSCHWCERYPNGTIDVNSLDLATRDGLRVSNTAAASTASDVFAYAIAPLVVLGLDGLLVLHDHRPARQWLIDMILIMEATVAAADVTQIFKYSVGRDRPFTHDLTLAELAQRNNRDDHKSFFSGHTSVTFALAVSGGTIATMRGYRLAPLIWASGLAVAVTTSYLRIASDQHFLTDVIAGAAIGSALGFVIPYVFHRARATRSSITPNVSPTIGGATLGVAGLW